MSSAYFSINVPTILQTMQTCMNQLLTPRTPTIANPSTTETTTQTIINLGLKLTLVTTSCFALNTLLQTAIWRSRLRDSKTNALAPGPSPIPFLGNLLSLRKNYYKTLYQFVDKPISIFWVLSTPFIVVNDDEGLRRVLGGANGLYTKPRYLGYRSRTLSSAVRAESARVADESIAYAPNGDASRAGLEKMVKTAFPKIVREMHALLTDLSHVRVEAGWEGGLHVVRRGVVRLNLDVLFGAQVGSDEGENADKIADVIGFAGVEFAKRMVNPLKVFVDMRSNVRFFLNVAQLIALGRRLSSRLDEVAGLEKGVPAGVSWVHAWIGKVGVIGKLGKVLGLLMASTQTVPLTVVWLLHMVGNDEHVTRRLKAELVDNDVHGISDLAYADMERLTYADAVVKETMRMYPPFPLMQRQAQRDDVLCGIRIPAGAIVYVVPWLMHRNERFWKRAHEFRPERFLEDEDGHGDGVCDWVYLPFGRGARMCAGSKLALMELKVVLVEAVLGFEWTSVREVGRGEDARFPDLGMMPRGVGIDMKCVSSGEEAEDVLAPSADQKVAKC